MGAGIAQVAAVAGHPVLLLDTRPGAASAAVQNIREMLEKLVAKGKLSQEARDAALGRLQSVESIDDLSSCDLVIEAIAEDLRAKQDLFRKLEAIVARGTLLATNTSSLSITAIASVLKNPDRFCGMHFFNPAPVMKLVEIVSGVATSPSTAATLFATAAAWGKSPVHARSTPGFIVNRVARPFYAEALRVLNEGGAEPATLDSVLREAGGFRMGPFELMDLIGNDVNYAVTQSVFEGFYGDQRFTPSLLQRNLVDAGHLGRKSGRGFYDYAAPLPGPASILPCNAPPRVRIHGSSALAMALRDRLTRAGCAVSESQQDADGCVLTAGAAVLYTCDGRTATARAASTGMRNTVLVDLALDYAAATRLAICAADQADPAALQQVADVLAAAGYAVSPMDDVPGMIVLRTVAMLSNEAADAVHQRVCTAAECDLAMRAGVNYPHGPLAWAEMLGLSFVVSVLEHLQHAYGEDRYRVAPLLRRKSLADGTFFAGPQGTIPERTSLLEKVMR